MTMKFVQLVFGGGIFPRGVSPSKPPGFALSPSPLLLAQGCCDGDTHQQPNPFSPAVTSESSAGLRRLHSQVTAA